MSKRQILDVEAKDCYVDFYDILDGKTPEEIIETMKAFRTGHPGRDLYFSVDSYGYDGGKELRIRERREETDKEFEKRIAEEKKASEAKKRTKAEKEAKEFLEYQRLQKKFQGKTVF